MKKDWVCSDRIIININEVVERCAVPLNIDIISTVLYGSRARGDNNSQSEYEIMILVDNNTPVDKYIKFNNCLRIELLRDKLVHVKILTYTPEIFEDILYNDKIVGTFLYMMCRDNIVISEKHRTFSLLKERLGNSEVKNEETFLAQCIDFARILGSEKWAQKWEKTLMQVKYLKKRREY